MTPAQIRHIRETMHMSQQDLADALRLAPNSGGRTVRGWELGERPITGPASLALEFLVKEFVEKRNGK